MKQKKIEKRRTAFFEPKRTLVSPQIFFDFLLVLGGAEAGRCEVQGAPQFYGTAQAIFFVFSCVRSFTSFHSRSSSEGLNLRSGDFREMPIYEIVCSTRSSALRDRRSETRLAVHRALWF